MGMSKTTLARVIGASNSVNIPAAVAALLQSKGGSLLLPGPNGTLRHGFQPGNYVESTGQTLTATDWAAGIVLDAARERGPELVSNPGPFDDTAGWSLAGSSDPSLLPDQSLLTLTATISGSATATSDVVVLAGKSYEVLVDVAEKSADQFSIRTASTHIPAGLNLNAGWNRFIVIPTGSAAIYFGNIGSLSAGAFIKIRSFSVRELPGTHAIQATTQYKPALKSVGATFCLRFDADDILNLTYPAGWGSSTVVTARATGAVTQTAQNLVGAQTITGAGDWYGRLAFPTALTAGELSLVQSFANTLSGYAP